MGLGPARCTRSVSIVGAAEAGVAGPDAAIIATAGHVDHGKTSLIRALTGQDLDTTPDERARGLTIVLGHTSLRLPSGHVISLIDAPGHHDFLASTIAGLHGCTAVLLAVAADEGWSRQTTEHVAVIRALGIATVIVAVTKSDLADPRAALRESLGRLQQAGVTAAGHAAFSTREPRSVDALGATVELAIGADPVSAVDGRARVWVDRSFTKPGVGTVVTGTLHSGSIHVGERLHTSQRSVRVRGLQHHGAQVDAARAPVRVAINLAGIGVAEVPRGTLLSGGEDDQRHAVVSGPIVASPQRQARDRWPREVLVSLGTASFAAGLSVRDGGARVRLPRAYAVRPGDRVVLRDPGGRSILGGVRIEQVGITKRPSRSSQPSVPPSGEPVADGVPQLMAHLAQQPWQPPGAEDLKRWGVGGATLRDLGAQGAVLYLGRGLVVHQRVAAEALDRLRDLDPPFTPSQARAAWGTSRRIALAVLDHLDRTHRTSGDPQRGRYIVGDQPQEWAMGRTQE